MTDAPRIYTPFWHLQKAEQQPELGNLVIVDTPGPNEAGENLRLQAVVEEQLRKSSIVLIVLDFTQLKNEAAEKVKEDVKKVIKLRGEDNLYVLINKVDQRREGDMSPEQVQQFVAAEFGIGDADNNNRVFEISARRAFTSANFLVELQQNQELNIIEMKAARALAQEVFGIDWEEELKEVKIEDLQRKAERLLKKSGFDSFLNGAINALMAKAAPLCMESALKMARGRLDELNNEAQLRQSAINAGQEKLSLELGALEADLQSLSDCRNRLQEVDRLKTNLDQQLNTILEKLKQDAKASLATYFTHQEYQRGDLLKKGGMAAKSFFNELSKRFKSEIKPTGSGVIEFNNLREAEDFTEHVVGDKALIDLINGIQVSKDVIRYRKKRGWFGQLFDKLDGSDNQRRLLLDGNLIAGQEALYKWVLELSDSLRISQVALEVTQNSLLEARDAIRNQKQRLQRQEEALFELSNQFNQLAEQVSTRLSKLEARMRQLEVRVAAHEDLDQIVTAWAAGQTYTQLPWAVQVVLLAREVFSSSVVMYELQTGDTKRYRHLLVNKIIATSKQLPDSFFGLGDLLDQSWVVMTKEDQELTAALLEIRSVPQQRLVNIPHLFVIGTTLELATLPTEARPSKPAQSALALCRAQIDIISRTTDAREFITAVVEETANNSIAMINNYSKKI